MTNIDLSTYKEEFLPEGVKVESYATADNILINLKDKGLVLFHYNNVYNMLYPFYHNNIYKYEFQDNSVEGIMNQLEEQTNKSDDTKKTRKNKLIEEFLKYSGAEKCVLTDKIYSETWIKYSETGNEWRLYNFDFYCAESIQGMDKLLANNTIRQVILPLDDASIQKAIKTGGVEGVKIVGNVIKTLGNKELIEKIRSIEI